MKKFLKDEKLYKQYIANVMTIIVGILFYFIISNFPTITAFIKKLLSILSPFIWGGMLAFILLKFEAWIEKVIPIKNFKTKRTVSSIIAVAISAVIVAIFISILVPQMVTSIGQLAIVIEDFTSNATSWLDDLSKTSILPDDIINDLYKYSSSLVTVLWEFAKTSIPNIIDFTKNTFSAVLDFVLGFIVAIYILNERDSLASNISKLSRAILSKKAYEESEKIVKLAYDKFSGFLVGKVVDSIIVGVLCFIAMTIMGLDFSVLISIIVGVTNIIPFFGPFIGAIPSGLILLIISPKQAILFAIMVFVLQQIDGNIIGPKILGGSVGLSSLWIMFAIIIGGGYFGFMGMLLGVPVFAVIYFTLKEYVELKIKKKEENGE